MPTPVSAARQCLAGEAAAALDEAVAVARRRCHAQTTSLHVVSALLSLPSSSSSLLRDALARARSAAYSPRLQFKALELCFSVALDRLPSSSSSSSSSSNAQQQSSSSSTSSAPSEPPVSNSLMAAIKRSQANQRRNPETFHLYHHQQHMQMQQQQQQQQQQPQSPSFAGVKVELQQLILSILDDPVVSRVFGEAGFRSCDIKFAVLRPPPASILRYPRPARCPPLFLCNFSTTGDEFDSVSHRSFSFPFSRNLLYSDGSDENCRRIGEVLVKKKGRNPLLVGAGAAEALQDLAGVVGREKWASLPQELTGSTFFSVEKDVAEFVASGEDRSWVETRIEELGRVVASGPSVLVSVGDLKGFLDDGGGEEKQEGLGYVVSELTRLVCGDTGRIWLVGSSASYETYMKFLARFPSVDKDWDLQLLPITSVKVGSPGLSPKRNSLLESFVPFGGFFPMASNSVVSSSRPQPFASRCHHCNEKYEQEVAVVLKEHSVPVADMHKASLPSWLQKAPVSFGNLDLATTKNDGTVLNGKLVDLQKKWNDICQRLHCENSILETDPCQAGSQSFPRIVGFPQISDKESINQVGKNSNFSEGQNRDGNVFPMEVSLEKAHSVTQSLSTPVVSEPSKENTLPELDLRLSKSEPLKTDCLRSQSNAQSGDHTSPSFLVSVSTDLVLGTVPVSPCKTSKPTPQVHTPCDGGPSRCFSSKNFDMISESVAVTSLHSSLSFSYIDSPIVSTKFSALSPSTSPKVTEAGVSVFENRGLNSSSLSPRFDPRDFKTLYRSLTEKVGRQEEAIYAISEAITRCRAGHGRRGGACMKGNIWLSFLGPDRIGKKKIAIALAELLFGSKERLISVDLGLQDGTSSSYRICDQGGTSGDDDNFRVKMVVDHIAGEISKMPWSVVFLENVDKADFLVQSSLSQAIRTGRFSDSHRRDISTSNTIFVTATSEVRDKTTSREENGIFFEERILSAQRWQMKILIDSALKPLNVSRNNDIPIVSRRESWSKQDSPSAVFVNKRKLNNADDADKQSKSSETTKRANKSLNTFLDLNMPFEETTANDAGSSSNESNSASSDSSTAWLEEFFGSVDETVVFKPFDFDTLADNILKEITKSFRNTIGSRCKLEIDPKAMDQILAATWLMEGMGALSDWLQEVLTRSFIEVRERYNLSTHTILRLVACEEVFMVEHPPGILLPSSIGLN